MNINQDLQNYYNESRLYIDRIQSHDENYLTTYISLIKSKLHFLPSQKGKLLELGCGGGQSTNYLAERLNNFHCIGTDISELAIEEARDKYHLDNLVFQVVDAHSLPFPDEEFEIVSSCDVIEHLPDTETALSEMLRVIKSKGLLIIKAPHIRNPIIPLIDFFSFRSRYPFTKNWTDNIPRFFLISFDFLKKSFSSKVNFRYRVPDLSDTKVGNDADAVYEVCVIDIVKFLKHNGFRILNIGQARHNKLTSKIYTKILPFFSSVGIVAQKM
jgi:ubiquinone/menaquinone biosynthesis C-methylase UbiE